MKIVVKENQFKKLINEDLGVSRASIAYVNLVFNKIKDIVSNFVKSTKRNDYTVEDIVIGLDDIKKIWQNSVDDFLDLPIEIINLELTLKKSSQKANVKFGTSGAAYTVRKKNSKSYLKKPSLLIPKFILEEPELNQTLVASIDIDIYVFDGFDDSTIDELFYDLRDTLSHEMNHVLEHFMRGIKDTPITIGLGLSGNKNLNINREIFSVWDEFLTYVYYSESFEVNAMTQEMYSKRLRMPFEEIQQTKYWKYAKKMENFDANKFFDKLVLKIEEVNPDAIVVLLKSMYKWFMKDYISYMKVQGLKVPDKINNSKHVLGLMRLLEPQIRKSGKKLLKNFMRLYSLNPED